MDKLLKTLENHQEWQAKYMSQLASERGYMMAKIPIERFLKEIVEKGEFYLRVNRDRLPDILQSGRIKSLMETGVGTTAGGPKTRAEAVDALFGTRAAKLQASDYPKYGYLSVADGKLDLLANDEMSWHYGNAVFRLDKEMMMNRTTLTVGSSLNFGLFSMMVPTRTDRIMATCLPGPKNRSAHVEATINVGMSHYYFLAEAIMGGGINSKNFYRINELLGGQAPSFECFELQFHGLLRLGQEVKVLWIYPEDDIPALQSLQQSYAAKGVTLNIYQPQ